MVGMDRGGPSGLAPPTEVTMPARAGIPPNI
jgi:hypothetical protein